MPGLAKTTAIKALGESCSLSFSRVQFTPDLLPADVVGTQIYNPQTSEFQVKKGPIFAHLVLADEINRALKLKFNLLYFKLWKKNKLR